MTSVAVDMGLPVDRLLLESSGAGKEVESLLAQTAERPGVWVADMPLGDRCPVRERKLEGGAGT